MNAKRILAALNEDFSDENVATAIDWLKSKKPKNRSADKVLKLVFLHPLLEQELEWLTAWSKASDWDFIAMHIHELKSFLLFEWIIQLLNSEPNHVDAGRLWENLLQNFRNIEIESGAEKWLTHERDSDPHSPGVMRELLHLDPTSHRIQLAKQIYEQNADVFLLCALIEYARDVDSCTIGEQLLERSEEAWSKEFIANALTNCDLEAHKESIGRFLANPDCHQSARHYVRFITMEKDIALFLLDWISGHHELKLAKDLLTRPLMMEAEDKNGDILWNWYKSGEQNDVRLEVCLRVFDNSWCPLPPEAADYVSRWISNNKKTHKLQKYAVKAAARVRKTFSNAVLDDGDGEDDFKLYAVEKTKGQSESIFEEAMDEAGEKLDYMCGVTQQIRTAANVFKATREPADLAKLRTELSRANLSFKATLFEKLLGTGITEFADLALETLRTPRLYKRWGPDYRNVGAMLLDVFRSGQRNEEVLPLAEEWLKIKYDKYEADLYDQVSKIVLETKKTTN